eukprot:937385-Amphidinium_carterae.1
MIGLAQIHGMPMIRRSTRRRNHHQVGSRTRPMVGVQEPMKMFRPMLVGEMPKRDASSARLSPEATELILQCLPAHFCVVDYKMIAAIGCCLRNPNNRSTEENTHFQTDNKAKRYTERKTLYEEFCEGVIAGRHAPDTPTHDRHRPQNVCCSHALTRETLDEWYDLNGFKRHGIQCLWGILEAALGVRCLRDACSEQGT